MKDKSVVEACLRDAESELQAAIENLRTGKGLPVNQPRTAAASIPADISANDMDDMAAIFFAQQAKKHTAESQLPIHPWAKTIYCTRHFDKIDDEVNNIKKDTSHAATSAAAVDELYKIFSLRYNTTVL